MNKEIATKTQRHKDKKNVPSCPGALVAENNIRR
jgi:hypothetical protein